MVYCGDWCGVEWYSVGLVWCTAGIGVVWSGIVWDWCGVKSCSAVLQYVVWWLHVLR